MSAALGLAVQATKSRSAPSPDFTWFTDDFSIVSCLGPGQAVLDKDISDIFMEKYGNLFTANDTSYVAPTGNDTNSGTSWAAPYATLAKAVRNTARHTIMVWPGTYEWAGFYDTDTGGIRPKRIIAPMGGVYIRSIGDDLTAATWTANGTYPNVYQTTLSTTYRVMRVLANDLKDPYGEAFPLAICASVAAVDTSTFGWHFDNATKVLSVRRGTINIQASGKSNLEAVYALNGDANTRMYSTKVYIENLTFIGNYIWALTRSGQPGPIVYAKRCTFKYPVQSAFLVAGGTVVSQDCRVHRGTLDGANYTATNGATAYGVEINFQTEAMGDVLTFGINQTLNPIAASAENKNGSSNHDGLVVRINGYHGGALGPQIADTADSKSWLLGTEAGLSMAMGDTQRVGMQFQGNEVWLDNTYSQGNYYGLYATTGAVVYTYNAGGTQLTSSATFTPYSPPL